ncbi:MAG: hypothetical protein AAB074_12360 [Planctomycetota bacterium]
MTGPGAERIVHSGPHRVRRTWRQLVAFVAAALLAFPLSSAAEMVQTPNSDPRQLESALREALPGQAARAALVVGPDGPHAAAINSLLLQAIIYGSIVAIVMLVGIISIIGYGISKKKKEEKPLSLTR